MGLISKDGANDPNHNFGDGWSCWNATIEYGGGTRVGVN